MTRWQADQVASALPVTRPGFRLIELGCANGLLLRALRDRFPGLDLAGVEPSPKMAEAVRSAGLAVHNDLVDDAPFADASVDGVVAFGSFIQMRDPNAGLAAIARLVRPGGRFLLDVPNDASLIRLLARAVGRGRGLLGAACWARTAPVASPRRCCRRRITQVGSTTTRAGRSTRCCVGTAFASSRCACASRATSRTGGIGWGRRWRSRRR